MRCWPGSPPARCSARTRKVILQLLEIPQALPALEGVAMELDDCSFPTLQEVICTDDPNKAFKDCNWALLVGSFPRKQGMERKELLGINGKIFVGQGKALAANAAKDVRILVVGNPCNTNCLVGYNNGKDIPAEQLDGHDAARPQPRPHRPGQEGRRRQRGRDADDHLGQPQQHAVPRLHQRQDQGPAGHRKSSPIAAGWRTRSCR